jgi:glycosyltransferase involved in cell wall biosynthesis
VSVVVDNFNYGRFVELAVRSVLEQARPAVDVVVVDDGSTDDSLARLRRFGGSIVVVAKENGGQASAINAGFRRCQGDVVVFLDADDVLYPDALARIEDAFDDGVAKVHYRLDAIDADGTPLGFTNPAKGHRLPSGSIVEQLLATGRYTTPVMSGNAYARSALEQIMPVPEREFRISADGYLVTLAPLHGEVRAIDDALGAYRIHGTNLWAVDGLDPARFHASVLHDLDKRRVLVDAARAAGYTVSPELERRDHLHLRNRLASYRLSRSTHPIAGDRRLPLAWRGVVATLRAPDLNIRRRLLFAAWFVAVAALPRRLAVTLVAWLFTPQRRPAGLRRTVALAGDRRGAA